MEDNPPDHRSPLRQEGSDLSNASAAIASPTSPYQRHGYRRMASQGSVNFADLPPQSASPNTSNFEFGPSNRNARGLGITGQLVSIPRVPVGSRSSVTPPTPSKPFSNESTDTRNSPMTPQTPSSSKPLLSPTWPRHHSGNYTYDGGGLGITRDGSMDEQDISKGKRTAFVNTSDISFGENEEQSERTTSMMNDNDNTRLLEGCATKHDIHSSRASWLSISILMLSIYSTTFSAIWLILAMVQPRYGRAIHSGGSLTPSTASTLFALIAKTIELSFVTVFVTFLGQVLSRRSLVKSSRGVTIAELTMRTWVIQPGFMITHWQHLQHAAITILGGISLTAAFVAMFYTTASDALVSPHLKYGKWENRLMYGLVQASYANPIFIEENCQTPITTAIDPGNAGLTCLSVEHAGQAYHNSLAYLDTWAGISAAGEGVSSDLSQRPQAVGMLFDNTTVTGSWVATNTSNMTSAYQTHTRIINNVTMSMPHAGIFAASHDAKNGILQPEDLAGVGEYSVRASVVSPTVNVLCVNMNKTELAPLIYVTWPNAKKLLNSTSVPGQEMAAEDYDNDIQLEPGQSYLNSTVVDDIFQWGAAYPDQTRQPPVFPMYPIDYNSITNISVPNNDDSIYLLIKSASTPDFTICQMRSFLSPFCSTQYNVSGATGGHLQSHCEDPSDSMAYDKSVPSPPVTGNADWRNVGSEWITALSLNTGISNGNSSTSRLLSQMIPTVPTWGPVQLNLLMPSMAETLSVMVGSTLLLSTTGSTFYHFWNYTGTILSPGIYEPFNASLSSQQYTSGPTQRWQSVFSIVLLLVFATNAFCLVYFFLRSGLVTDYSEPQNLFALAVNSPPSERLSGSCGAGPEGSQLNVDWHVSQEDGSNHFFIKEGNRGMSQEQYELRNRRARQSLKTMSSYSRLSNKRGSWL